MAFVAYATSNLYPEKYLIKLNENVSILDSGLGQAVSTKKYEFYIILFTQNKKNKPK